MSRGLGDVYKRQYQYLPKNNNFNVNFYKKMPLFLCIFLSILSCSKEKVKERQIGGKYEENI